VISAIRVENLGKRYQVGRGFGPYRTFRERLTELGGRPFRRRQPPEAKKADDFWALQDVSFEVHPGEVVGIIGRNGAGKSTLLKILSRITRPTMGMVQLKGRVGSLLEVGTGFHPELTGRENIYLNGSILGMSQREIGRKFDEIVAFAEVDRFLDTPVKRYSSGMYVRLAFAVAAHLDLEILVVDEILAVGDLSFQRKCLNKMGSAARSGRTILLVSHNMASIVNLCSRAVLLYRGKVAYVGATQDVVRAHASMLTSTKGGDLDLSSSPARRRGCPALLKRIRLLDACGVAKDRFFAGEAMNVEFTFDPILPLTDPQFGIGVDDWMGARVFSVGTFLSDAVLPRLRGASRVVCRINELALPPGRYLMSLSAGTPQEMLLDALDHAVAFDVDPTDFYGNGRLPGAGLGCVLVRSKWETSQIDQAID
jgi:lipopolysaccharide transport system ATP-binding protein